MVQLKLRKKMRLTVEIDLSSCTSRGGMRLLNSPYRNSDDSIWVVRDHHTQRQRDSSHIFPSLTIRDHKRERRDAFSVPIVRNSQRIEDVPLRKWDIITVRKPEKHRQLTISIFLLFRCFDIAIRPRFPAVPAQTRIP